MLSLFLLFFSKTAVYAKSIVNDPVKNEKGIYVLNSEKTDISLNTQNIYNETSDNGSFRFFIPTEFMSGAGAAGFTDAENNNDTLLMFTGDFMCLRGQQYSAEIKGGYNFSPSFAFVEPLFKSADFVCGNLETLISKSNPLTKNQNTVNGQPQCNGPEAYLSALKKAGVDAVVTANNHCCDWGKSGINETKQMLEKHKIPNVGTNSEGENNRYIIINVKGINIAVLSYSHIINQRGKMSAYDLETMVNCYDIVQVNKDIHDAKENGADFVAVYCHWGTENTEELNWFQKNDSKDIANAGADIIIGSHPHCLQRCEYIQTDDNRQVMCMYSMGNFVSSMAREINNDTIILCVKINKNPYNKRVLIKDISYIPCFVTSYNGKNNVIIPDLPEYNGNITNSTLTASLKRISRIFSNINYY